MVSLIIIGLIIIAIIIAVIAIQAFRNPLGFSFFTNVLRLRFGI